MFRIGLGLLMVTVQLQYRRGFVFVACYGLFVAGFWFVSARVWNAFWFVFVKVCLSWFWFLLVRVCLRWVFVCCLLWFVCSRDLVCIC